MKKKTRKMSITVKLLVPCIVMNLIVCFVLCAIMNTRMENSMVEMGGETAMLAAKAASHTFTIEELDQAIAAGPGSAEYEKVRSVLDADRDDLGISYLYTLYTDGTTVYYGVDADGDEDEETAPGVKFERSYGELQRAFGGELYYEGEIAQTAYGSLITSYVPLVQDGKVVALLGCDYNADAIQSKIVNNVKIGILVAVLCVILSSLLELVLIGAVIRNLRKVDSKLQELVSNEGDLTQVIEVTSGDEMELIAQNVNALLTYIREIMISIAHSAGVLGESSEIIVAELEEAEGNITDVSATMEEMSAAMQETTASINQINNAIGEMFEFIEEIYGKAMEGNSLTNEIRESAEGIRDAAVEAGEDAKVKTQEMSSLLNAKIEKSKAVERINKLTEDIIGITSQTNLLALNASIEAARAGEAGRGFAVVADEIGKLASDSAKAASQIREVSGIVVEAVNELAAEAESMITFMDETVLEGYNSLIATSESYSDDAKKINEMMKEFAGESEKLQENADDIKQSVEAVNIAVEESAKGVVSVSEMAVSLSGNVGGIEKKAEENNAIAEELTTEVKKFKLD